MSHTAGRPHAPSALSLHSRYTGAAGPSLVALHYGCPAPMTDMPGPCHLSAAPMTDMTEMTDGWHPRCEGPLPPVQERQRDQGEGGGKRDRAQTCHTRRIRHGRALLLSEVVSEASGVGGRR